MLETAHVEAVTTAKLSLAREFYDVIYEFGGGRGCCGGGAARAHVAT
jgi:hypothetical protein